MSLITCVYLGFLKEIFENLMILSQFCAFSTYFRISTHRPVIPSTFAVTWIVHNL